MDAPQSRDEVQAIVDALCLAVNDSDLDIQWEPRAVLVSRGRYDAVGKMIDPVYRGLWEIRRYRDQTQTAGWREWRRVCFITEPETHNGTTMMYADGAYAPVGDWVVDFMRQCDAANRDRLEKVLRDQRMVDTELEKDAANREDDAGSAIMDAVWFEKEYAGGVGEYKGCGADFAGMPQKSSEAPSSLIATE